MRSPSLQRVRQLTIVAHKRVGQRSGERKIEGMSSCLNIIQSDRASFRIMRHSGPEQAS